MGAFNHFETYLPNKHVDATCGMTKDNIMVIFHFKPVSILIKMTSSIFITSLQFVMELNSQPHHI